MSYEVRLAANYAFGALSAAAAVSDTVLSSNDFATRLPTGLSTTTYVPITLHDPGAGLHEIVWSTSHAASASTATVLRGRELTTSLAWPAGTLWTVAPTLRDGVLPLANRAALPTDPHVGLKCLIRNEQAVIERYLASWGPPAAHLRQTVAQAIATHTAVAVQFQSEDYDNAGGHDPATLNTRYVIKQAGRYQLAGGATFVYNATGSRVVEWFKNGAAIPSGQSTAMTMQTGGTYLAAKTLVVQLAVNDYVELWAYHEAGVTINTMITLPEAQSHLSAQFMGG